MASAPPQNLDSDLGFGSVVARESRKRLLNADGTFNVRREGLPLLQSLSLYHYLLTMSWPRFLWSVIGAYIGCNALFAAAFVACGPGALTGLERLTAAQRFPSAFFFSVHTLATIGYGNIAPQNLAANLVVTIESLVGLLGFAVVAGFVFARFARPVAQIAFSRHAIIAPYRGMTAFMFRIVNRRSSELVQLQTTVLLTRRKAGVDGGREFIPLKLERESVVFFPLTWTVVHPIDDSSPLRGENDQTLRATEAEFLVLINGFDETFSQTVHTRSSYKAEDVVWGARFRSVFNPPHADGTLSVNIRKLDDLERVELS